MKVPNRLPQTAADVDDWFIPAAALLGPCPCAGDMPVVPVDGFLAGGEIGVLPHVHDETEKRGRMPEEAVISILVSNGDHTSGGVALTGGQAAQLVVVLIAALRLNNLADVAIHRLGDLDSPGVN